ncbi:hypothetical protein M405DRAFT_883533 [Rhizopogon salebrosus TDB-379]|nr:hypothetical protein M405DRAFT_883533 [Rhizopogon salebrosus TDB-379]
MSSESWPPQLREWVARCLSQMSDANRTDAQAELRQAIANAFAEKTLWTTDWAGVQLQSLMPKAPPTINSLKRKMNDTPQLSKKAKKAAAQKHANAGLDFGDQAALSRRAERFQREHEQERQKSTRGQASLQANNQNAQLLNRISRADSPSVFGTNPDDPEADPNVLDWDKYTIVGTNQELFKDYLRLTSV